MPDQPRVPAEELIAAFEIAALSTRDFGLPRHLHPRHAAHAEIDSRLVFTVEQRDALREHLLRLAEEDEHVVAGAAVGSLAVDGGDRFSDLDLTFGIADHVPVADVLTVWTRALIDELDAVHLADLERGPTTYRVFLLPGRASVRPLDDTGGSLSSRRATVPASVR